jgi:hypothetical protein
MKLIKILEKINFNIIDNPDSMWNRQSQKRKNTDEPHIMKKLGIDDPYPERMAEPSMSMLDIAIDVMDGENEGEDDADNESC